MARNSVIIKSKSVPFKPKIDQNEPKIHLSNLDKKLEWIENRNKYPVLCNKSRIYHFALILKTFNSTGELLLSDLTSWAELKKESTDFVDEMSEFQKEQYDNWTRDNLQEIESKSLSLQTTSQVVYFEAGKNMKVSWHRDI